MDNTPFNTLMIEMLRRATAAFPELRAQLDAYLAMKAKAEERDAGNKLTAAARKAREVLRNNLLLQMPLKRALRQYEKAVRKRRAKFQKAAAEAMLSYVEWEQYQIELDILNEDNPAIDADVPPSRERTDQDKRDAMVRPFVDKLIDRKISLSTIGRLTDLSADLFARLIADRRDDPDFQNPENLWVHMMRAGILDAFSGSMTPEEAAAIDYARHTLKEDAGAAEFAMKAREECGLPKGFSSAFLEGIYHLKSSLDDLTEGQANAYARASKLVRDNDVTLLGKLLGLHDPANQDRLQALVHFIYQRNRYEVHDPALQIQVVAVKNEFDRLEAHNRSTDDWAREVPKMLSSLAEDFADTVPSLEAFEMLLASGFRLSSTYDEVTRLSELRAAEQRAELFDVDVLWACAQNADFKVIDQTVILEWDEGYEEADARVWDRASWEAEHGPIFGDHEDDDRKPIGASGDRFFRDEDVAIDNEIADSGPSEMKPQEALPYDEIHGSGEREDLPNREGAGEGEARKPSESGSLSKVDQGQIQPDSVGQSAPGPDAETSDDQIAEEVSAQTPGSVSGVPEGGQRAPHRKPNPNRPTRFEMPHFDQFDDEDFR